MTTTYKLPPELGGGECTLDRVVGAGNTWPNHRVVKVPAPTVGAWYVLVPKDALTEVKPPLPPEPPVGAYRIGGVLCMRVSSEPAKCWVYQTADELFDEKTFADIYAEHGPNIVPLVPVPEPGEASLKMIDADGSSCHIRASGPGLRFAATILVDGHVVGLSANQARVAGRVLLTAADETDRRVSDVG